MLILVYTSLEVHAVWVEHWSYVYSKAHDRKEVTTMCVGGQYHSIELEDSNRMLSCACVHGDSSCSSQPPQHMAGFNWAASSTGPSVHWSQCVSDWLRSRFMFLPTRHLSRYSAKGEILLYRWSRPYSNRFNLRLEERSEQPKSKCYYRIQASIEKMLSYIEPLTYPQIMWENRIHSCSEPQTPCLVWTGKPSLHSLLLLSIGMSERLGNCSQKITYNGCVPFPWDIMCTNYVQHVGVAGKNTLPFIYY